MSLIFFVKVEAGKECLLDYMTESKIDVGWKARCVEQIWTDSIDVDNLRTQR